MCRESHRNSGSDLEPDPVGGGGGGSRKPGLEVEALSYESRGPERARLQIGLRPADDIQIAVGVLIFSFVLEMWTLWVAYKAVKTSADALNMTFGEYLKEGPDPMAVAVLLEDAAAVTGVMLAGASIGLFILTGNPIWDAIGSIIIAILLGAVAIFLMVKNRKALLGQTVTSGMSDGVMAVLKSDDAVEAVHDVKATIMGADSFRFKAEIDFDGQTIAKRWLEKQDVAAIYAKATQDQESFEAFVHTLGEDLCEALGDEVGGR